MNRSVVVGSSVARGGGHSRRHPRNSVLGLLAVIGLVLVATFLVYGSDSADAPGSSGWSVGQVLPSPDGSEVAFLGSSASSDPLRTRLVLAGEPPKEISPPGVHARSFAWMPDGGSLLLAYSDELGGEHRTLFAIIDVGGEVERWIEPDRDGVANAGIAIHPSGRSAVMPVGELSPFDGPTELWQLDLVTGVIEAPVMTGTSGEMQSDPSFIDSDRLLFRSGQLVSATVGPNGWIGTLELGDGTTARLTPDDLTAGSPSVTPGGGFVVFDASPGNERSDRGLWYVRIDGAEEPVLLIEDLPGRAAALEPDGRAVLVVDAGSPGDTSTIRRVELPDDAPWLSE